MKRRGLTFALMAAVLLSWAAASFAQDPVVVGPNIYKVIFENEKVRVSEITFKPGDSIPPHSHPDHFVYVLTAGKLAISRPDGTTQDFEGTPGQIVWINAETHWAKNTGDTEFKALVVELKPLPHYE